MATAPPSPGSPGQLNAPPQSPLQPPQPPPPMAKPPDSGPMPGGQAGPDDNPLKGLVSMAANMDRGLTALAASLPDGAQEFRQARLLIQQGLAKGLKSADVGQLSTSPTNAGSQFPGSMGSSMSLT